jgi:sugar/nucleoside kinase (ribokinase family)
MPDLGARRLDLAPGSLRIAGPLTISTGGAVSNTGIALHRLGVRTRLVGLTGDDPLGALLRRVLDQESPGLGDGIVTRKGAGTSYSVMLSSAATDRIAVHFPGANDDFGASDVDPAALRGAELLHVGYPPLMRRLCESDGAELETIMRAGHAAGLATSLDMAVPDERVGDVDWRRLLARVLPATDVFMPSMGELRTMLGRPSGVPSATGDLPAQATAQVSADVSAEVPAEPPDEAEIRELADECLRIGCTIAAIKLGRFGLYVRTSSRQRLLKLGARLIGLDVETWSDRELWSPIFEVDVRGTTGSGDATIAGFLTGLLDGLDPAETMNLACAVGSLCVEADDALSGIASRQQADARVHSELPRPAPPLPDTWHRYAGEILAGPNDSAEAQAAEERAGGRAEA